MSKQITRAILDSVVQKAINAAVSNGTTKKQKRNQGNRNRRKNPNSQNNQNSSIAPNARSNTYRLSPPKMTSSATNCRIKHEEMVTTVLSKDDFNVISLTLNPGLSSTFPWLSTQARGWEKYKFHKLVFKYKSRAATNTAGSVSLFPDYDPSDSPPNSEQHASTYSGFTDDAYWKNFSTALNSSQLQKERYVRLLARSSDMSIADYDLGKMYVGSVGATTPDITVGKVYVEYDVEFNIPVIDPISLNNSNSLTFFGTTGLSTNLQPFGPNFTDFHNDYTQYRFTVSGRHLTISNLQNGDGYCLTIQFEGVGFGDHDPAVVERMENKYTGIDTLIGTTKYVYTQWFTVDPGQTSVMIEPQVLASTSQAYSIVTFSKANWEFVS